MQDTLDKLADDVKRSVIETCAKVAEIHCLRTSEGDWAKGYNAAVAEIAAKIRKL